jgi:hypothetical protein
MQKPTSAPLVGEDAIFLFAFDFDLSAFCRIGSGEGAPVIIKHCRHIRIIRLQARISHRK